LFPLALKEDVAEERAEQHQRNDDYAPQNMNMRLDRGAELRDGDDERNQVGPEGECRCQCDRKISATIEREGSVAVQNAETREYCCRHRSECGESNDQRRSIQTMQERKLFGPALGEYKREERQHADRENGNLATRDIADLRSHFSGPASRREQRVAEAQPMPHSAEKRREASEITTGILAVRTANPSTRARPQPCIKVAIRDPPASSNPRSPASAVY